MSRECNLPLKYKTPPSLREVYAWNVAIDAKKKQVDCCRQCFKGSGTWTWLEGKPECMCVKPISVWTQTWPWGRIRPRTRECPWMWKTDTKHGSPTLTTTPTRNSTKLIKYFYDYAYRRDSTRHSLIFPSTTTMRMSMQSQLVKMCYPRFCTWPYNVHYFYEWT